MKYVLLQFDWKESPSYIIQPIQRILPEVAPKGGFLMGVPDTGGSMLVVVLSDQHISPEQAQGLYNLFDDEEFDSDGQDGDVLRSEIIKFVGPLPIATKWDKRSEE